MLQQLLELFGKPQFSLIEAHQASTHLSIGLLLGAVGFDVAAFLHKGKSGIWRESAFWMQLAGLGFLVITFALGFYGNPFAGKTNELAQKADWHRNFAYVALGVFSVLSLWRIARFKRWNRIEASTFVLLNGLGLLVITLTGYLGGHIGD